MNRKMHDTANNGVILIPAEDISPRTCETGSRRILRVAAYCRVSTYEDRQLDSLDNQMEHYGQVISSNCNYELVKVYSDEGISGCSIRSRRGFCSMIADCEAGLIDLIITKSISRFARNTQDSLNYTRKLKDMGIGVIFEKEGISTMESSGELLLTLFSCFAQEESRSISENTTWGIRSRFRQGIPHLNTNVLLGYDKDVSGRLVINDEEAETVRIIYRLYLEGHSLSSIASELNRSGTPGVHGDAKWCANTISRMLRNEKYKGDILMQKTFTVNYLTRRQVRNTGQLEQYYISNHHPAIIAPVEWEAAQQEIRRRKEFCEKHGLRGFSSTGGSSGGSPFYARIFCTECRCKLQRIYRKGVKKPYWNCPECGNRIDESQLRAAFCDAFNAIVTRRDELMRLWTDMLSVGTALQRVRARQMIDITEGGTIPFEVPELTRAVLQEAWLNQNSAVEFTLLYEGFDSIADT